MSSIIKKRKGKNTYYYLVESARVNGQPRIVKQIYLGKAEDILKRLKSNSAPQEVVVRSFGIETAAMAMAKDIGLIEIIDQVAGKRNQGISVGTYLTLAAINRISRPCSKRKIKDWFKSSVLSSKLNIKESGLAPQRFWDAMARVDEDHIAEIERRLASKVIEKFNISTSCLVLDMTNFFTFIDSQTKCSLAKRGRSKQKRHDLRQVGLALLVSTDYSIPLFSRPYPGNAAESKTFSKVCVELAKRHKELSALAGQITLVFDKGNNSEQNFLDLDASAYHFIGSLTPSHHKELLNIRLDEFTPAQDNKLEGILIYSTTKHIFGAKRQVVVSFSRRLFDKQMRGFDQTLSKALRELDNLAKQVKSPKSRRSEQRVKDLIEKITSPTWVKEVLDVSLKKGSKGLCLSWRINQKNFDEIKRTYFGKRILFTDRFDLTAEQIVKFYRCQNSVESAFRQMKDSDFISFSPMFHWTDDKIRVHAFYCVIALVLVNLMHRRVEKAGIDISCKAMLEQLLDIKLVDLVYFPEGKGRPWTKKAVSKLNKTQKQLIDALGLQRYLPMGNTTRL